MRDLKMLLTLAFMGRYRLMFNRKFWFEWHHSRLRNGL